MYPKSLYCALLYSSRLYSKVFALQIFRSAHLTPLYLQLFLIRCIILLLFSLMVTRQLSFSSGAWEKVLPVHFLLQLVLDMRTEV